MKTTRKMYIGGILMAFWSVILVFQATNLKIQNSKFSQTCLSKLSNLATPMDNAMEEEEEDDDEFNLEFTLLNTFRHELYILKHYSFQVHLIRDPHREIFSPPPLA